MCLEFNHSFSENSAFYFTSYIPYVSFSSQTMTGDESMQSLNASHFNRHLLIYFCLHLLLYHSAWPLVFTLPEPKDSFQPRSCLIVDFKYAPCSVTNGSISQIWCCNGKFSLLFWGLNVAQGTKRSDVFHCEA